MIKQTRHIHRHSNGFSLIETLVALFIFSTLLITMFHLLQDLAEREKARGMAKYMVTTARAMEQLLDDPKNFEIFYEAAMANGGGYQTLADSSSFQEHDNIAKDAEIISTGKWIQASPVLGTNFSRRNPFGSYTRIFLAISDDMTDPNDPEGLDIMIVTDGRYNNRLMRLVAQYAGPGGGWINGYIDGDWNNSQYTDKADAMAVGEYGNWKLRLADRLQSIAWYIGDPLDPSGSLKPGSKTIGYPVYYSHVDLDDKTGDYLYRHADADTTRNTMYAALNLGGNNILGADDVVIGDAAAAKGFDATSAPVPECEGSVLCVNGTAVVNGSAYIGGAMTVNGNARIADTASVGALRLQNGLSAGNQAAYDANNLLVVNGPNSTQDLVTVTGDAALNGGATISGAGTVNGKVDAATVTVASGNSLSAANITGAASMFASQVNTGGLNVTKNLETGVVADGDVTVTGTTTVATDIQDTANLVSNGGSISAGQLNINSMSISNFGTCTSGCGQ